MDKIHQMKKEFLIFLFSKNLSPKTVKDYLYYIDKFYDLIQKDNTEGDVKTEVSKFLSHFRNVGARTSLINFFEFLGIEISIPRITGRRKQIVVVPLTHEELRKLSKAMFERNVKWV